MGRKFISLAMVIVTLDVYLRSQLSPNDPLFLFISNNFAVNVGMIVISTLVLMTSFKKNFNSWFSYVACAALATILCITGSLSLFSNGVSYWLSGILPPLNAMLILESGIILALCSLSYQHEPRPAYIKLPTVALPKLAFPVPKILHSPSSTGRRTQPA
jgi:hypothetical protein